MKRSFVLILSVLLVTLFTNTLFAQGLTARGVKFGLNSSKLGGEVTDIEDMDKNSILGFAVGGFISIYIVKKRKFSI